ncbi:MAG: PAS domain S-box protein [Deltaproteobacteria bacterium]|nr:PAS domain S-box protein [Deltaproteobacteria bacterium]
MKRISLNRKMGLFSKITCLISLMLIIAIGISTVLSIRAQTRIIETELIQKNRIVAKHLGSSIKNAFWSLNWLFVEKQMQEITASKDVTFLKLVKPSGEVYMAAGDTGDEKGISVHDVMDTEEQILRDGPYSKSAGLTKVIVTPLKIGNDKWVLIMGLSLQQVTEGTRMIIKENIAWGGGIFLLGVLVSFWFARGMTRPIQELVEGTKAIGKGNLDYRIDIKGLDELSDLANSFNHMAQDLKKTTTSRDLLIKEIQERKQVEEALRESEERYRILVEGSFDGIFVQKGPKIIFANERLHKMLGYGAGELLGLDHWLVYHPEFQQITRKRAEARMRGEKVTTHYEVKLSRKDGSWFYGEVGARVINFAEAPGIQIWVKDIHERKQAERALQESEQRMKAILRASPVGIGLVINRKLVWANETLSRMAGYEEGDLLAQRVRELYTDDEEYERVGRELYTDIELLGTTQVETRWVRSDGAVIDCMLRACSLDVNDPSKGQIVVVNDISEAKRLEAQLQRAQKMEAIGTLAGGVAHDLNNILSGLVSYPDLLLMQIPPDSSLRKPILTIQKSGEKAAAVVQDLLTLARRGVAVAEVVNLNEMVSQYLNSPEYEKLTSFHPGIDIETHLETEALNVMGSPVHLSKTVMNLVSNAAEALPEGGRIILSTENRYIDRPVRGYEDVVEGDYVVLTVTDTGVGISPEDIKKIFEPFYTKKKMGRSGTGLGMAVVWGTVKDHHGYIDVQSREGAGTSFTLYFPVTREQRHIDETLLSLKDYKGKGESILVIDDVEQQRDIATGMLRELGYSVTSVSSGEEAVQYVKDNPVDLLLLDMIMDPGMDGLETYRRIIQFCPGQKAIIASGFSETERVKAAQTLGAGAYVKKPFLSDKIGQAVRAELDKGISS